MGASQISFQTVRAVGLSNFAGYDRSMKDKIIRLGTLFLKAMLIAILIVAVAAYIFFSPPVLTKFNGSIILLPLEPGAEYACDSVNNIKHDENYFLNKNGDKLHSWLFRLPDPNAPVVLFCHGNAGNIGHRLMLAKYLMDAGASVFLFDYRAFGKSSGKKDLPGIIDDSRAAYDYLVKEKKFKPSQIVIYGESIGGGNACALASSVDSGGLILDSTFTSLLQIAKKKVSFFRVYPDFLQPSPAFDNIATLRGKHAPLLVIHGKIDELIPYEEAQENFAAASEPKQMLELPNSTHNWKEPDAKIYIEGVKKFLQQVRANITS